MGGKVYFGPQFGTDTVHRGGEDSAPGREGMTEAGA